MPEDNRQMLGESYVGVSFNPSGSGDVDTIKQKAAELIDLIGNLPTGFAATALFDHYWARAKSIAITHVETAFCVRNQSRNQMRTLLAFILYLFSIIGYPLYSFTMNHRWGNHRWWAAFCLLSCLLGVPGRSSGLGLVAHHKSYPGSGVVVSWLDSQKYKRLNVMTNPLLKARLEATLRRHEGERRYVYRCPAGKLTIGVGRNLEGRGITADESTYLLNNDIDLAIADCRALFPDFDSFGLPRRQALANIVFNLGRARLSGFRRMIAAVNAGDWAKAAEEAQDSKWASQLPHRSSEIIFALRHNAAP